MKNKKSRVTHQECKTERQMVTFVIYLMFKLRWIFATITQKHREYGLVHTQWKRKHKDNNL